MKNVFKLSLIAIIGLGSLLLSFSSQASVVGNIEGLFHEKAETILVAGDDLNALSNKLQEKFSSVLTFITNVIEGPTLKPFNTFWVFKKFQLPKIIFIFLLSFIGLVVVRRFIEKVWLYHPHLKDRTIERGDRIFFYLVPWVFFLAIGTSLSESMDLGPLLKKSLNGILFILSTMFPIRQIALLTYRVETEFFELNYKEKLKKVAPSFIHNWVFYLVFLGILSIGFIFLCSLLIPLLFMVDSQISFLNRNFFSSSILLFFVHFFIYFYVMNLALFILSLEKYVESKKKESPKIHPSRFKYYWIHHGKHWYFLGYIVIIAAFLSWVALSFGFILPKVSQLFLIIALGSVTILSNDVTGNVLNYISKCLTEKLISPKLQRILDTRKMFRYMGYALYYFFIFCGLSYIGGENDILKDILEFLKIFTNKLFWTSLILMSVISVKNFILSIIEKVIKSRTESEVASRSGNRLYTFLIIFRSIIPALLWIPASICIMTIFGLNGKTILMVLAGMAAILVFIGQNIFQDIIKGVTFILEDVVIMGEEVHINQVCGRIERLSLQNVSIRDYSGFLHTFPFGKIDSIVSTEWLYANLVIDVTIGYESQVDLALKIMREIMAEMKSESPYKKLITGDMLDVGIESFGEYGLVLKGRIKVVPGNLRFLRWEYHRRLKKLFDKNNIQIPTIETLRPSKLKK